MNFSSATRLLLKNGRVFNSPLVISGKCGPALEPSLSSRLITISSVRLASGNPVSSASSQLTDTTATSSFSSQLPDTTATSSATLTQTENISGSSDAFVSPFSDGSSTFITNLTEPPFTELGLSHGWPSGYVQTLMEFFHIDIGLPWWQVIGLTTVFLRIFVFPLVIIAQRNMVTLNNHQPTIQKLQVEQQLAGVRGDMEKSKFAMQALTNYMSVHNCHPVKSVFPIFAQASCFMTMFFALRGMTNAPVPSMTTGGLAWFSDLTLADPTYVLPLVTASTIYLQLYLGADGMNADTMPPIMKKILYIMPLVSIPVMIQFPAALNVYWLTNNIISVCQAKVIRLPGMRDRLGIGEMVRWKPEDLPLTTFQEELKREMAAQRSKAAKAEATKKREKEELWKEEKKRREELLTAFAEEEKASRDARKGLK